MEVDEYSFWSKYFMKTLYYTASSLDGFIADPKNSLDWLFQFGANIRFVSGDVQLVHQEMVAAAGEKNIWLVGGGELVGQFYDLGLLDEIIVSIASVTLGGGAPLLPREIATPPLRLLSVKAYGEAFVQLHYEVPHT
jgi:dihydrofolate reductase